MINDKICNIFTTINSTMKYYVYGASSKYMNNKQAQKNINIEN